MIIVPAAGDGRRFREAGYRAPKHEIPLLGNPMVEWVLENVQPLDPSGGTVVATQEAYGRTRGAVETVHRVLRIHRPANDERVVIANCDQLLDLSSVSASAAIGNGVIFTFKSANPAHSYVTTDGDRITGIIEKPSIPPTDRAVSGVYLFPNPHGITAAIHEVMAMVENHPKDEVYLSTAIALMIDQGYTLYAHDVPTAILGTPEDFQRFQAAAHVLRYMETAVGRA